MQGNDITPDIFHILSQWFEDMSVLENCGTYGVKVFIYGQHGT